MEVKSGLTLKQLKMPFVRLIRIICINKTIRYKRMKRGLTLKQFQKKTKEITLKMKIRLKMTRTMLIMMMNMKMKMMMMLKMKLKMKVTVTVEMKIKMTAMS
ncbi:unnamed protein product [Brassica rapa]|uniref:Uncharacterized protein n=1 Tax=Brassica campestris TaxID=3711 RepID=A0A3P5Y8M8_BRACM|nr:unnamed protein product [Brassica rapa]VDC60144.1 unnamed protein product [Brassica rapa]